MTIQIDKSRFQIQWRDPAALTPNPLNHRRHPEAQKTVLRAALNEEGWIDPVIFNIRTNRILDGHARVEEAIVAGVPAVPVLELDVDEATERKILARHDRIGALAEIDWDKLAASVGDLGDLGVSAAELGWLDVPELDLGAGAVGDPEQLVETEIPSPPKQPATRSGDLWLLGGHRLLCGDSRSAEDVARVMAGRRAALFATDPPYLVDYDGTNHPAGRNKDWAETYHEWDAAGQGAELYHDFIRLAKELAILPHAAWWCWHACRRQAMLEQVWTEAGAFVHQQILWFKSRAVLTHSVLLWAHEPCFFGWVKGQKPPINHLERNPTTVWQIPSSEVENHEHPTSKPVKCFGIPMLLTTQPGDVCFEPFSGSGSQVMAGEQLGRLVFGLELEPAYCDVIVQRWQAFTGREATLEGDGRPFAAIAGERAQ